MEFDERLRRLKELEIELSTALQHVHESLAMYDGHPKHYLNGVEILGSPKTVRLQMKFREKFHSAALEVWVSALVALMSSEEKEKLFNYVDRIGAQHELYGTARVVADIDMPKVE